MRVATSEATWRANRISEWTALRDSYAALSTFRRGKKKALHRKPGVREKTWQENRAGPHLDTFTWDSLVAWTQLDQYAERLLTRPEPVAVAMTIERAWDTLFVFWLITKPDATLERLDLALYQAWENRPGDVASRRTLLNGLTEDPANHAECFERATFALAELTRIASATQSDSHPVTVARKALQNLISSAGLFAWHRSDLGIAERTPWVSTPASVEAGASIPAFFAAVDEALLSLICSDGRGLERWVRGYLDREVEAAPGAWGSGFKGDVLTLKHIAEWRTDELRKPERCEDWNAALERLAERRMFLERLDTSSIRPDDEPSSRPQFVRADIGKLTPSAAPTAASEGRRPVWVEDIALRVDSLIRQSDLILETFRDSVRRCCAERREATRSHQRVDAEGGTSPGYLDKLLPPPAGKAYTREEGHLVLAAIHDAVNSQHVERKLIDPWAGMTLEQLKASGDIAANMSYIAALAGVPELTGAHRFCLVSVLAEVEAALWSGATSGDIHFGGKQTNTVLATAPGLPPGGQDLVQFLSGSADQPVAVVDLPKPLLNSDLLTVMDADGLIEFGRRNHCSAGGKLIIERGWEFVSVTGPHKKPMPDFITETLNWKGDERVRHHVRLTAKGRVAASRLALAAEAKLDTDTAMIASAPLRADGNGKAGGMPRDEANVRVREYLKQHPDAKARDVADNVGCALGQVSSLSAWKAVQEQRKKQRELKGPKVVSLTPALEANMDHRGKVGRRIATAPANDDATKTLDALVAEQAADFEPSPLDEGGTRPPERGGRHEQTRLFMNSASLLLPGKSPVHGLFM